MIAGHQTMLGGGKVKYPWDYRVEYFSVASTYPRFECGPLMQYNPNWANEDWQNTSSDFCRSIKANTSGYGIFAYPQSTSTDQKAFGSLASFTCYPYAGRYNIGMWCNWPNAIPSSSLQGVMNTNTITKGFFYPVNATTVAYGVSQVDKSVETSMQMTSPDNCVRPAASFSVLMYSDNCVAPPYTYEQSRVYVGTKFYEAGFNCNLSGNLKMKVRFVPCVLNNTPYICEMSTKTLIPNNLGGSVSYGPRVPDDYDCWNAPYPELEYIESDGTQWIDTGYVPNENTRVQIRFNNVAPASEVIFGFIPPTSGTTWDNIDWRFFGNPTIYYDIMSDRLNGSTLTAGVWRELELGNYYVKDLVTNSNLLSGTRKTTISTTSTFKLDHSDQHGNNSKNKWKYVKIIEGDEMVMDLVAVKAGSRACMYDKISKRLFDTPTGSFIAGPYAQKGN